MPISHLTNANRTPLAAANRESGSRAVRIVDAVTRFLPFGVAILFVEQIVAGYAVFNVDAGVLMSIVLDFVKEGKVPFVGQPFYERLYLGPLAPLLMAVPIKLAMKPSLAYAYIALFSLVALPIFFAAARRISDDRLFPYVATTIFGLMMNMWAAPIRPLNTTFAPPFFALAIFFLAHGLKGRKMDMLMAWVCIGLCVQLHLSIGVLALTVLWYAATRGWRSFLAQAVIGGGVILSLHATVIVNMLTETVPVLDRVISPDSARPWGVLGWAYAKLIFRWILAGSAMVGGVGVVYLARGVREAFSRLHARWRTVDADTFAAVHIAFVFAILPILTVAKGHRKTGYMMAAVPFVAILIARGASSEIERLRSDPRHWYRSLAPWFVLSLAILLGLHAGRAAVWVEKPDQCNYWRMLRFDDQVSIARAIRRGAAQWPGYRVESFVFASELGSTEPRLRARDTVTYATLLRWVERMPDFRDNPPEPVVGVFVRPQDMPTPAKMESLMAGKPVIGDIATGCLAATIFESRVPLPNLQPPF
ncbi:hypothetical protein K8I61_06300 [bacterium]|nr:hypothetical protein [bacterium]